MPSPRLAVLSDFDGTITTVDTAVFILERYARGDWMEPDRQFNDGRISIEHCIKDQLGMIGIGQERIVRELDEVVRPRADFDALLRFCRSRGHLIEVTSAGLDFYIHHFLTANGWGDIDVIAPRCVETAQGLSFTFPPRLYQDAANFKEDRVRYHQSRGLAVAYVGDGTSDVPAAKRADLAFAIKGSTLARRLAADGEPFHEIEDFSEMVERLSDR